MVRDVKEVLKAMGWAEGFKLPVSNPENQELEAEIEQLLQQKAQSVVKFEVAKDRVGALRRNAKLLDEEKNTNQSLILALRSNTDGEIITIRSCEAECNQMNYDMKRMEGEMKTTNGRIKSVQAEINAFTKELEELQKALKWEDDAQFAWEEELAKGDHQNDVLRNLELHDFDKFKELELKRKTLQIDLLSQQETEQNKANLMLRTQLTLQAQTSSFQEIRKNRSKLMKRWCEATKMLEDRKTANEQLENAANRTKMETDELIEAIEPIQRRAEAQMRENVQLRGGIEKFQSMYKQGEDLAVEKKKTLDQLKDEIFNIEKQTSDLNSKNNLLKAKIKDLHEVSKSRKEKAERTNTVCIKLKSKLDSLNIKLMTDEQKRKNADEIYELGLKVLKEEERELDRLQMTISSLYAELTQLKHESTLQKSEADLAKKDLEKVEVDLKEIINETSRLKRDIQLKEEGNVYLMQRLKETLEDDLSSDLQRKLIDESENIKLSIQSQKREQTIIRQQIKYLRKELKDLNRTLNKGKQELDQLGSLSTDLQLKMVGGNKLLKEAQDEQNRTMLDLNLLRMQVSAAKELCKKTNDQINNMERKKIIVESALQERTMDLKAHKEKLVTRKKLLQEERMNLKKSVDHLNQRIKQVNNRHQIIMDTICKDENGEPNSVAYFQIKMAQQKRELIDQGDELQTTIEKTEKEILAMENTLRLVNCANDNFKANLETIELNGPEMQRFERTEGEYHQEHEQYLSNTRMIQDMSNALNRTRANIVKLSEEGQEVEQLWKQKEKDIEALSKSLATKQAKLATATKVLKKLMSDVKNSKGNATYRHTMRDIENRITVEQNKSALQQLADFTQNYIESRPIVNALLNENGISLEDYEPQRPTRENGSEASVVSSRTGSSASYDSARGINQYKGSEVSLSPSVVRLDPTLLIPDERKKAFKGLSAKMNK